MSTPQTTVSPIVVATPAGDRLDPDATYALAAKAHLLDATNLEVFSSDATKNPKAFVLNFAEGVFNELSAVKEHEKGQTEQDEADSQALLEKHLSHIAIRAQALGLKLTFSLAPAAATN